jgi:hypothetical protein
VGGQRLIRTCATTLLALALIPFAIVGKGDERKRRGPLRLSPLPVYWSFALYMLLLGVFLMLAPPSFFGPSWHFFKQLPQNGFWMGLCCLWLGGFQVIALWQRWGYGKLSFLFFLNGFVFWTSGLSIATAGYLGHQGVMEAPFMCYAGIHAFVHSGVLMIEARRHPETKGRHAK